MDPTTGLSLVWNEEFNRWRDAWTTRQTLFTQDSECAKADPSCARITDGQMILSVRDDPKNPGKYLTGHVGTQGRKEFNAYGFFEARVKFPAIPGTLCGWWLQTTEDYIPGQAEVDVAENGGRRVIQHTIWYRDPGQGIGEFHEPPPHIESNLGSRDAQAQYHDYGVLWTPAGYTFTIDRQPMGTLTEGLSDRPKFLVLSIKIPNYLLKTFDPESIRDYKMRTKWVRVWQ